MKLEQNIETTGLKDRSEVVWSDVRSALKRSPEDRIDLIFVDPPYSMKVPDVQLDLEAIVTGGFLSDEGRIVVHRPAKESRLEPLGLEVVWEREFGQSNLLVFTHEEEDA